MAGKANTRCLHHLKDLQGMNDPFLNKVFDTIEQFDMFTKSERLLVCLSGGADSVSLLLCLKMLGYNVRGVVLAHLSEHNNSPKLAYGTVAQKIQSAGASVGKDIILDLGHQEKVGNIFKIKE